MFPATNKYSFSPNTSNSLNIIFNNLTMNISNYFWYFQSAIPPRICDMIVQYGKAEKQREIMAITGGFGRDRDLEKQPLTKDEIKIYKRKEIQILFG